VTRVPLSPKHPDRICWGCDKYCPADDLACGNGTVRTQHPIELFGEDWVEWVAGRERSAAAQRPANGAISHDDELIDCRRT
jgi:hypothetical protein